MVWQLIVELTQKHFQLGLPILESYCAAFRCLRKSANLRAQSRPVGRRN